MSDVRRSLAHDDIELRRKLARGTGEESAKALKILVALLSTTAASVKINTLAIDLPDLNDRIADRIALGIKQSPGKMGDFFCWKPVATNQGIGNEVCPLKHVFMRPVRNDV